MLLGLKEVEKDFVQLTVFVMKKNCFKIAYLIFLKGLKKIFLIVCVCPLSPAGVNKTVYGIDAMNPSSRDDFTEFGKLLKDKITQYEKSLYYANFLEALVRDVCISCK